MLPNFPSLLRITNTADTPTASPVHRGFLSTVKPKVLLAHSLLSRITRYMTASNSPQAQMASQPYKHKTTEVFAKPPNSFRTVFCRSTATATAAQAKAIAAPRTKEPLGESIGMCRRESKYHLKSSRGRADHHTLCSSIVVKRERHRLTHDFPSPGLSHRLLGFVAGQDFYPVLSIWNAIKKGDSTRVEVKVSEFFLNAELVLVAYSRFARQRHHPFLPHRYQLARQYRLIYPAAGTQFVERSLAGSAN